MLPTHGDDVATSPGGEPNDDPDFFDSRSRCRRALRRALITALIRTT
jgi:hypothetical protein